MSTTNVKSVLRVSLSELSTIRPFVRSFKSFSWPCCEYEFRLTLSFEFFDTECQATVGLTEVQLKNVDHMSWLFKPLTSNIQATETEASCNHKHTFLADYQSPTVFEIVVKDNRFKC